MFHVKILPRHTFYKYLEMLYFAEEAFDKYFVNLYKRVQLIDAFNQNVCQCFLQTFHVSKFLSGI